MDVDTVCPVVLLLGESEVTVSTKVEGGISNNPSAIIAAITCTGVNVMFSLQICHRFCCGPSEHCS
jgi:hypothetical protein